MENNLITINLNKIISSNCILGEGLFVKNFQAAWVDIHKNHLFILENMSLSKYFITNKPSVVFNVIDDKVILGTDIGLVSYSLEDKKESILSYVPHKNKIKEYRSNDGGFCGEHKLLSYMHRSDPKNNPGMIYILLKDSYLLLDDGLHIPNSFIEIRPFEILISDSLKGQIWLYKIDNDGSLLDKILWAQLESGIAPDGGCIINDLIFIALWDGSSIAVFNKDGTLLTNLSLPVIRPTNCKFDSVSSQLWLTSASEGLSKDDIELYPSSGNTFIYDLEIKH
jgi:sugar lactone lactonase YvrE